MSNFKQKLHEMLYLSVNGFAGVGGIMPFYTIHVIYFFFPFQLCLQQMVIIMFAQINEYLKNKEARQHKKCPSTQ